MRGPPSGEATLPSAGSKDSVVGLHRESHLLSRRTAQSCAIGHVVSGWHMVANRIAHSVLCALVMPNLALDRRSIAPLDLAASLSCQMADLHQPRGTDGWVLDFGPGFCLLAVGHTLFSVLSVSATCALVSLDHKRKSTSGEPIAGFRRRCSI